MFEAAFSSLDDILDRTRQQLASYRGQRPGEDDGQFIAQLVTEFLAAGRQQPDHRPGHRMMALTVYSLVIAQDRMARYSARIAELEDLLAMRDDALEIAWDIIDKHDAAAEK